jgi:hypothetical protein
MANFASAFLFVSALLSPFLLAILFIKKQWKRTGLAILMVYLITYVGLSLGGSYTSANHGGNDWKREWCPKGLVYEYTSRAGRSKTDFTLAGAAFWPCILIDHLLWHRTQKAQV